MRVWFDWRFPPLMPVPWPTRDRVIPVFPRGTWGGGGGAPVAVLAAPRVPMSTAAVPAAAARKSRRWRWHVLLSSMVIEILLPAFGALTQGALFRTIISIQPYRKEEILSP